MVQTATPRPTRADSAAAVRKKREILEAASRVFRDQGLHAAGMRDIATEAGMRAGNLYYYFENKGELLAFCQLDTLAALQELACWVREQDLPPSARLQLLVTGHVRLLNEATPGSLAHLEVEALEEPWRGEVLARRGDYETAFREVIRDGIAAGIFRPTDVKVAVMAILGAVNWTVKWFRPAGEKSAGEIGELVAEHMVRGLLAPGVELERPAMSLPRLEVFGGECEGSEDDDAR